MKRVSDENLWCSQSPVPLGREYLVRNLESRMVRTGLLNNLHELGPGESGINTRFLDRFWEMFAVDDTCMCRTFVAREGGVRIPTEREGGGKSGDIFVVGSTASPDVRAILKKTKAPVATPRITFARLPAHPDATAMNAANEGVAAAGGREILAVGLDGFAAQSIVSALVGVVLDVAAAEQRRPRLAEVFARQYDAFVCEGRGYALLETANAGDLADFIASFDGTDTELDFAMVVAARDVLAALTVLKGTDFAFSHNDLKARNVFVHDTRSGKKGPTRGLPSGGDPDTYPFVFKIADFDKSAISFNGMRFYNRGRRAVAATVRPRWVGERMDGFFSLEGLVSDVAGLAGTRSRGWTFQPQTMFSPYAMHPMFDVFTLMYSLAREKRIATMVAQDFLQGFSSAFKFPRLLQQMFPVRAYPTVVSSLDTRQATDEAVVQARSINFTVGDLSRIGVPLASELPGLFKSLHIVPPRLRERPLASIASDDIASGSSWAQ
jgi:hypothetical protein